MESDLKKIVPETGEAGPLHQQHPGTGDGQIHVMGNYGAGLSMSMDMEAVLAENKQLKERLDHFLKAFPAFEKKRAKLMNLLEEEQTLEELVEKLKSSTEEAHRVMFQTQDEAAGLSRKIDALKLMGNRTDAAGGNPWSLEGKDAIAILPEEMWQMILDKVDDPKDRWNCSNTCGLFRKILGDWKKPTWLFMNALPFLVAHLPQRKILECRLVSKGWNMVVENFLENHASLRPYVIKNLTESRMLAQVPSVILEDKFKLRTNFSLSRMEYFQSSKPDFPYTPGRNPFLGRAVTLVIGLKSSEGSDASCWGWGFSSNMDDLDWDDIEEMNNEFWSTIHSFLKSFGEHIWYLTLDSCKGRLGHGDDCEHDFDKKMAKLMTDLFLLAPNLRKLRLITSAQENYNYVEDIDASSFPPAPNLETIDASSRHVQDNHALLVALLERHHDALRAIHVTGHIWLVVCELDWPNLTELDLCHHIDEEDLKRLICAMEMEQLPRLSKLGVDMENIGLDGLMDVLHKSFATTRLNTLRLHGAAGTRPFHQLRWKFCMSPTLKTLEVDFGSTDGFYDFLLHFPFVENIQVYRVSRKGTTNKDQTPLSHIQNWEKSNRKETKTNKEQNGVPGELDLQKYVNIFWIGNVYRSNIWGLLPRLKLFTCGSDVFTRAGYDQFMEKVEEQQKK